MVEGGSSINWEFVKNRYVDEIRIIHLPVIVGGENVPTFVGGEGFKSLSKVLKLKIQKFFQIDDFLISEWKVQK